MDARFEELANAMKFRASFLGYNFIADHGEPLTNSWAKRIFVFLFYFNGIVAFVSLIFGVYESRALLYNAVNLSKLKFKPQTAQY